MMRRRIVIVLLLSIVFVVFKGQTADAVESDEGKASQFAPEISALVYPPVEYTDQELDLRWDFSGLETYSFQFDQTFYVISDMGMRPDENAPSQAHNSATGDLNIKSLGEGQARVVFQDMVMTMEIQTPEGPEKMSQKMPVQVAGEIDETGRHLESQNPGLLPTDSIFPLPGKPLRSGESVIKPVKVPFNAFGSMLYVRGEEKITLTGFVSRNGRLCAQLDVVQVAKDLTIPPEMEGEYFYSQMQTARAFFDLERKRFAEIIIAVRMIMKVKSPRPDVSFSDSKGFEDRIPKEIKMSMDSDNLIRVVEK